MSIFKKVSLAVLILGSLVGCTWADLLACREYLFAGLRINQSEGWLLSAPLLGNERNFPTVLGALPDDLVIEEVEDFLAIQTQRIDKRGHRQLALAVDTNIYNVLGVKLKVQPRSAIRNDARSKEQFARAVRLATIMIEQHAR